MPEYQTIHETIEVVGTYAHAAFTPKKMKWNNRIFPIDTITFTTDMRDGNVRKRIYSVVSKGTVYRISFNRETEQWFLEEIWCE